jgi:light-regulated signal transduction histidine kinase (bacteriophytochrome)
MLQRSNEELDRFAYITSHDLKAPLRGIANLASWIREDLGDGLPEETAEHIRLLGNRVHRMEALIDAVLAYSRAGRVSTKPEPVDTRALVHEIVELLPPTRARIVADPSLPAFTTARVPLQQSLMNLITNAVKHNTNPQPEVHVSCRDDGPHFELSVRDNGPGIDPRYHDKIFVIFQMLESRDKTNGTGIGLALVKKNVESVGGSVRVESEPGHGATFLVRWPKQIKQPGIDVSQDAQSSARG